MATIDTSLFPSANVRFQMAEAPSSLDMGAIQQQKLANQVTAQNLATSKYNAQRAKLTDAMRDVMTHETPEDAIASIDRHVADGTLTAEQAADAKSKVPVRGADGSLPQGAMAAWRRLNYDDYVATNEQLYAQQLENEKQQRISDIMSMGAAPTPAAPAPVDQEQALFNQLNPQPAAPAAAPTTNALVPSIAQQKVNMLYAMGEHQLAGALQKQIESTEPKWVERTDNQSKWFEDVNEQSPSFGKTRSKIKMGATPGQELTNERLSVSAKDYPNVAQAIVDGRLAPNRVNSRNASILENTLKLNPDFDLESATATAIGTEAGARTLGTVGANQAAAGNEAATMIPIARLYADKVGAGQFKSLNDLSNWASKHTGDKAIVQLNTSLNSLVNSYARAINPRGMPTVSDKNHAREILDAGLSNGQLNATLDVMEQEIAAARAGTAAARSEVNPGGKTPPAAGGGTKTPPPAAIDMLLKNPSTAAKFDQIFGAGASAKYLPKGK